jgi:predicted dehydrogenase
MPKVTRRRFVKTSLAAGAGLMAAPAIIRGQNSNDKIGVAVIGAGGRGGSHVQAWVADSRTNITVIVDVDPKNGTSRCDYVEGKQGFRPILVKDMREALDHPNVDVISTATPNHWHALCGVWAMQAGKDAYIEKPICHNVWEGAALVAAAKKYNRMCQVGTQCRSSSAVQGAVDFIAAGGIGEVKLARGLCYKRRKSIGAKGSYDIPDAIDFNLWSGPAQYTDPKLTRGRFHYDWHWQRLYGNGDLGNQGPHQTDVARWGLGLDRHPNTIVSYGGRLGYQAEQKNEGYVDAGDTANTEVSIYDYGDKCIVFETRGLGVDDSDDQELNTLFQSNKGNKIGVVFYGSEGYVVQRTYADCVAYDKKMNVIKEFKGGGDHFGNFLDAVTSRDAKVLNADARCGHLSAGVSHLGNISFYLGEKNNTSIAEAAEQLSQIKSLDDNSETLDRTVKHLQKNGVDLDKYPLAIGPVLKFDPEKEVFLNNDDANKLLTRDYREGFVCPTADKV